MGRSEPSWAPAAQASFRKEQRAKHARTIINKTIPKLLASDKRAKQGVENATLIPNPSTTSKVGANDRGKTKKSKAKANEFGPEESTIANVEEQGDIDIRIKTLDTLSAADALRKSTKSRKNVAVLNMASPLRPGGGVLNGATSQEESLCVRTTLLRSLKEEWYRLPEVGGILSPDVLVFRMSTRPDGGELAKSERFYIDVVTAAMMRFPDTAEAPSEQKDDSDDEEEEKDDEEENEAEKVYLNQSDRDLALQKIRAVLQILKSQGTQQVVLGAWGCGAYGNPVNEIASAWRKALLGSSTKANRAQPVNWRPLKEVVFAIKEVKMASAFAKAWGDDIEIGQGDDEDEDSSNGNSSNGDEETHEETDLLRKIEELEARIQQVQTPMLKSGLEGTLNNLRRQLASKKA